MTNTEKNIGTLKEPFKSKIQALLSRCKAMGIILIVTSALRTIEAQNTLYAQGRTLPGKIVTRAKGGQSAHNFGLAADICPLDNNGKAWWGAPDDVWNAVHRVGEELGLVTGYDFKSIKDNPHFEDKDWKVARAAWLATGKS